MSLFRRLFRTATVTAAVVLGASSAPARQPVPLPLTVLDATGQTKSDTVSPASAFGSRLFGSPSAPACPTCPQSPYYPCYPTPSATVPGAPVTGNPPTQPPTQPPIGNPIQPPGTGTTPEPPDLTGSGGEAGIGPRVGLNGYIENALPITMVRVQFDSAYDNNRPDRGEFFYAKCGCFNLPNAHGPPLMEKNIDYQSISTNIEYAFTQRFSAFVNLPVRFINPEVNQNASGISDVSFGTKYAFIYTQNRVVSFWLNWQAPSGSTTKGLGDGNWWVEPGLLYSERLSEKWQLFGELRFQIPLAPRSDFTGNLVRYGIGTSYTVAQGRWGYIAPVVETVGWTVLSGKELALDPSVLLSAHGDTIVNAKLGLRIGIGAPTPGTPYATRSDVYLGYARALTGDVWYKDMFRFEYRRFF